MLVTAAACGGNEDKPKLDGGMGSGSADAAVDAASVTNGGFASAWYRASTGGTPLDLEGYFHAWEPGIAVSAAVFGAYYPSVGSAMPLAVGACANITQPTFTNFASLVAGNTLKLTNGTTMLSMTGPATEGYYSGFNGSAPDTFVGPALSITAGTGSEAVGGPGTLALGAIGTIAIASEPLACNRATACSTGATLETTDDAYVVIAAVVVCRVAPTDVTIPIAAFANRADGTTTIRVISIRHSTNSLGAASYEVFLVNERSVTMNLST